MKKGFRIIALVLAILMLVGAFAASFAKEEVKWDKAVYAYGAGLNETQIQDTAKILGITNLDQTNKIIVNAEDLYKYLKQTSKDASMISSVYIEKAEEGTGLETVIADENMITKVTGEEYTNAALTAGVKDAKIYVGAYRPVTGSSALTGVYKAFEMNGEALDPKRIEVANQELETVNAIVTEHKDKESFSPEVMNNVIVYIKDSLIQFKQDNRTVATEAKIREIVTDATEKYELNNIITQNNINNLVVYFQNFQKSPAIDSQELKEQLDTFKKDLSKKVEEFLKDPKLKEGVEKAKDGAKKAADKAKEIVNSEEAKGIFQKIIDFFKEVFSKIAELFKG